MSAFGELSVCRVKFESLAHSIETLADTVRALTAISARSGDERASDVSNTIAAINSHTDSAIGAIEARVTARIVALENDMDDLKKSVHSMQSYGTGAAALGSVAIALWQAFM